MYLRYVRQTTSAGGFVPAKPSWAWRVPEALLALRACPDEWIDRRSIEELFGCSKTVAWRILRQAGVEPGPGGALLCRREDLITRLERITESGGAVEREIARRERLDAFLHRIRPAVIANMTKVVRDAEAEALLRSRFKQLPAGIDLSPGELRISFGDMNDFLQKFGAVLFALNNDLEAIQEYLDSPAAVKKGVA